MSTGNRFCASWCCNIAILTLLVGGDILGAPVPPADNRPVFHLADAELTSCVFVKASTLCLGSSDGTCRLLSLESQKVTQSWKLSEYPVWVSGYLERNRVLVQLDNFKQVGTLNLLTGKVETLLRFSKPVSHVLAIPQTAPTHIVSVCADGTVWLHDATSGEEVATKKLTFLSKNSCISDMSYSQQDNTLTLSIAGQESARDPSILILDAKCLKVTRSVAMNGIWIVSLARSSRKDGENSILYADCSDEMQRMQLTANTPIESSFRCPGIVSAIRFSPNEVYCVVRSAAGRIDVLDAKKLTLLQRLCGPTGSVYSFSFSPDSTKFSLMIRSGNITNLDVWTIPR
jgi:WD40 repeat protein